MKGEGRPEERPADHANGRLAAQDDDLVRIAEPLAVELELLADLAPAPWATELRRIAGTEG